MLKKSANAALKQSTDKLKERIEKMVANTDELVGATGMPIGGAGTPSESLLENLIGECDDHVFWMNFKKAAPMLFCSLMESNNAVKQVRDMSFMEELLKVKSLSGLMQKKLQKGDANIDVIEYSMATYMLENKLSVLKALNTTVEGDSEEKMTLNIQGTQKSMVIDLVKLRDCITFKDESVEEKNAKAEDYMTKIEDIDMTNITEDEFVAKAVAAIGEIKKNPQNKTLTKDTFIKVFKYTGDFAKLRSAVFKQSAQLERCEHYNKDHQKYLQALQKTIADEEKAYEKSSEIIFEKLSISPEMFEKSQQFLMQDPAIQMELFNLGIKMEQPPGAAPTDLKRETVIDLVKKSNDFAFEHFKTKYISVMGQDPMIMPVLISAIAHDWVFKNHNWTEE